MSTNTDNIDSPANATTKSPLATQGHMISATNPEPSSSSIIAPVMGGVVGGLIVVIAVVAVVIILSLLVIKRGQKRSLKVNDRKESVHGYNNALYDGKQTL